MQVEEFRKQFIRTELKISEDFGRILTILDFGNINYWFEKDRQDCDNVGLKDNEKIRIDLEGLKNFTYLFSEDVRFYYGTDNSKTGSIKFITVVKSFFGRNRVFSKPIQYVHHNLDADEFASNTRTAFVDKKGWFVKIPKCNFDVEMSVDAIRKMDSYDTLVMFSGDADFTALFRFLKKKGKKLILVKAGHITDSLKQSVDLIINAQRIKRYISKKELDIKQKPGV